MHRNEECRWHCCSDLLPLRVITVEMIKVVVEKKKKKEAAAKVLDGGDYSDYSTIEAMYV